MTPPSGSRISVAYEGADPVISIPVPRYGASRYFVGAFITLWLIGWGAGLRDAANQVLAGKGGLFIVVWLAGWTLGGGFACYVLFRILKSPVPETLKLKGETIVYDSGLPAFQAQFNRMRQRDAFRNFFPKRTRLEIPGSDLKTLKLRDTEQNNRLTVDVGAARMDLGRDATEAEREWLYGVLSQRYL